MPGAETEAALADLVIVMAPAWLALTEADEPGDVVAAPLGVLPVAMAVSLIEPASMSAWLTVYVAVQFSVPAGASEGCGHVMVPRLALPDAGDWLSVMAMADSVTLPLLVTANM